MKHGTPIRKKTEDNITSNNNIKENIEKKIKFKPPTLIEIQNYVIEKKLKVDSKQFYDYFTEGDWKDSKGNQVRNWKQKLLTWNKFNTKQQSYKRESVSYNTDFSEYDKFTKGGK